MTISTLVKAAKTPTGALLIGFLSREIAAATGFTVRALLKGTIRHAAAAQQSIKHYIDDVKAEISADEALKEANLSEEKLAGQPKASDSTITTATPVQ